MDSSPISGMWTELQRDNRVPKGVLTVTCERELQDLMKQIDLMVAGKKRDWEREMDALKSRLSIREKECKMQKSTLEEKHKEIGHLRHQLDSKEQKQRDYSTKYETELSRMKAELQRLQREYERLNKRYTKQKKECESEREKSMTESMDKSTVVKKLNNKLEDYRQRAKDWEIERRAQQQQIETLEAQRKAITEKCDFVQQQSQTYQSQLDKRRQILLSTELSLNSQISQLESKLTATTEALTAQNSKVEKLKSSLEEAVKSHKKAMDDNERLLGDLRKANTQLRKVEEVNLELQAELRARDGFLKMEEEDARQKTYNMSVMERTISEKDDIIKTLSDARSESENDQINSLKVTLREAQEQIRTSMRNERRLSGEKSHAQEALQCAQSECDQLKGQLEQKKSDILQLQLQLEDVTSSLNHVQNQVATMSSSHEAEIEGMKFELAKVTSDLHSNHTSLGAVSEKAAVMEDQLHSEQEDLNKKLAELKVASAQIDALRQENRHLRQTIIQQTQYNLDHSETENSMRDMQNSYTATIKTLEKENQALRDEMSALQHELASLEDRYDNQLQRALEEAQLSYRVEQTQDHRVQQVKEDSERQVSLMQDRLDSTINRYEDQLALLRRQKASLEEDLDSSRQYVRTLDFDDGYHRREEGVSYDNDSMSMTGSQVEEADYEMPDLGVSASEKFLQEEEERAKDLEDMIDNHIEQLKNNTSHTIRRHLGAKR